MPDDKPVLDSLFHWLDARGFEMTETHAASLRNLVTATDPFIHQLQAVANNTGRSFEGEALFNADEQETLQAAVHILRRTRDLVHLMKVKPSKPVRKLARSKR